MKSLLRFFSFALLLPSLLAADWTPFATIPEATGADEACFFGDWVTIDGRARPESPTYVWIWTQEGQLKAKVEVVEPRMAGIRMGKTERDSAVWEDDCFDLFLTHPDGTTYHLIVNARGTAYDEKNEKADWNGNWQIQVERELYRWTAEIAIPLQELGASSRPQGEEWGLQMGVCRTTVPAHGVYGWVSAPETRRFRDGRGRIRFANTAHPLGKIPGSENASVPEYQWSQGAVPQVVRVGSEPAGTEYLSHRIEYHVDGQPVYGVTCLKRASQVGRLLKETVERLREYTSPDVKAMIRGAEALMGLRAEETPEVYALLEEEAVRVRDRMLYFLYQREMEKKGRQEGEVVYGTLDSLTRLLPPQVFPGTIAGEIALEAGRNEREAAQVVLFAGAANLTLVEARLAGPLATQDGRTIPLEATALYRLGHVLTTTPEYDVDYVGLYPDVLMPISPFDVPSQGRETLWFSVQVPEDTAPGLYQGEILLQGKNTLPTAVPVRVRVRSFTIPRHSSLVSAFGVWPLNGQSQKLMQRYGYTLDSQAAYKMMFEHRLTPYFIAQTPKMLEKPYLPLEEGDGIVLEGEAVGAGDLEVALSTDKGGYSRLHFKVPAGRFQVACEKLRETMGSDRLYQMEITLRGCGGGRLRASLVRQGQEKGELIPWESSSCEVQKDGTIQEWAQWYYLAMEPPAVEAKVDWTEFDRQIQWGLDQGMTSHMADLPAPRPLWARLFRNHLEEKGWLKYFYTYLADEPVPDFYPVVNALLAPVKEVPGEHSLANMMTARSFPPELFFVDTWCPETYSYHPDLAAQEQAKGRNVWWYVAYGNRDPLPNVWIDSPIVEGRSWIWQTWKHNLDGILYWSVNWWGRRNPWATGAVFNDVSNGDGNFLYPDPSGTPLSSTRLEVLTDGLEDYELFCLLEACREPLEGKEPGLARRIQELLQVNPQVVVDWKNYSREAQPLLQERLRLMDCLDEAIAILGTQPPITRRPVRRPGLSPREIRENLERYHRHLEEEHARRAAKAQEILDQNGRPGDAPQDGLVLYYDFEGAGAILWDRSGNALDTALGGLERTPGHQGSALRTTPKGGLVLPPAAAILGATPQEGSVAFWMKPLGEKGEAGDIPVIFYLMATDRNWTPSGNDEIGIYVEEGFLRARLCGEGTRQAVFAQLPNPLKAGEWCHLAITWKEGRRTLYVNGTEAGSSSDPFVAPWLDGFPGCLGSHPCNVWVRERTCPADYDELRIYSRCLSSQEVKELAQ